jgi:uncharacterized damage-inducible protein DinB
MSTTPAFSPEYAASFRSHILQSLLQKELPVTCKVIAAVPDAKRDWKPEPKARSAWEVASHIATSDVWFLNGIADLTFPQGEERKVASKTPSELAAEYEKTFKAAADRVSKMTPQQLLTPVDFFGAFNMPAFAYLEFLLKHSVHHRAQLSTYLRPMGSKIPSIYGGSADEPWQG